MKFAVYQMALAAGSPTKNREKVYNWVKNIMENEKPDTIVLPELWTTSYVLDDLEELADEGLEPTKSFLSELAKRHHINIIGGSIANKVNGKLYNTALVFNRNGELIYTYSKIHLVPMLNEPAYLSGGEEKAEVFSLDGMKMGLIICYDLRFPELTRKLALEGAEVLFLPAEWPMARKDHWVNLQIARAIENQMYIVSANNVGTLDTVEYCGNSMIVDPWGDVIARGTDREEETLIGNLNPEKVIQVRKDVPIFDSRVPELY